MPKLEVRGVEIHYEEQGSGPETIVFSHGLLFSGEMFEAQVEAFSDRYRCLTFDFRGQGRSEVTEGGYDMDSLADDAAALIETLDAAPCHFVGLSMGGFVGQRLALRRPELLRSLTLLDTSAEPEPRETVGRYGRLNFVARWFGLRWVMGPVMQILFGPSWLSDPARDAEREVWRRRLLANHRIGITRAVRGVIQREGVLDQLGSIELPTLIMVGEADQATPLPKAEALHRGIEGSRLVVVPRAGHSSTIEEPAAVNQALGDFLAAVPS